MRQRPENFEAAEDPEATLVAPRFDADDARRAHPVVPLAGAPTRAPYYASARPRRGGRRSWAPALLAVALLAVAAVGGALATKFMQGRSAAETQGQTQFAPAPVAEAPPQPAAVVAPEAATGDAPARAASRDARPRRARADIAPAESARDRDEHGGREDEGRRGRDRDEDEGRRGKREGKRRERDEEIEKEMRKALKRVAGDKAPRLVDVLTSREQ